MNVTAEALEQRRPLRVVLPVLFVLALYGLSFLPRIATVPGLADAFSYAVAVLGAWYFLLLLRPVSGRAALQIQLQAVPAHYVQAAVQTSIFVYWAAYWPFIEGQALLIVAQIIFAYAFDALLHWTRGRSWRLGFGPFPIILSTNLFLCFKDEWFSLQFLMIAVGILGKEFVLWNKDGRRAHIFNPSALALFVFSIVLILTDSTDMTWAEQIAIKLNEPENIFVVIFLLGLIVQYLFNVTLVTLAAAAALYAANIAYSSVTGSYWFLDANIPIAVFLGLHLLVTDPATSPRTNGGRFLFGALYGLGVFGAYGLLEWLGEPRFYDKLLCVPILNMSIQLLDRAASKSNWLQSLLGDTSMGHRPKATNGLHMVVWIALFGWMLASNFVGDEHEGQTTAFWEQACTAGHRNACRNLVDVQRDNCFGGNANACNALGLGIVDGSLVTDDSLLDVHSFARACDLGSRPGCGNLASMLDAATVGELEKSCQARQARSCYVLGTINLMGFAGAPDLAGAFGHFDRSCELRFADGCSVLADMYRHGVGVEKNLENAAADYETACALSFAPSCSSLADLLDQGQGGNRDPLRATTLRRRACLLGLEQACAK